MTCCHLNWYCSVILSPLTCPQEEEILKEAVRTITTPGTTIFGELVERLFSLVPDPHLDYTYDSHTVSIFEISAITS